jgi:RNA recognition motif-containing protein
VTKTLYVGNLPWSTTEEDLAEAFSAYGNVESSRVAFDRETGRSRGFGFVEMADADAEKAMQALNGKDFGGREITVNEAMEKRARR